MKTWNPEAYAPCARCSTLRPFSKLADARCLDDFCARVKKKKKEPNPAGAVRPKSKRAKKDDGEDASNGRSSPG